MENTIEGEDIDVRKYRMGERMQERMQELKGNERKIETYAMERILS